MKKPFVIPIFLPHAGCPHQCVFCNQKAITGKSAIGAADEKLVATEVDKYLGYARKNRGQTLISFYGGNFLGLDKGLVEKLLLLAKSYVDAKKIDAIRFSTRPDTVSLKTLEMISAYPVTTVELGVQSLDDQVLRACRRGHTAKDSEQAAALVKKKGYRLGLQMMTGLPKDTDEKSIESAKKIAAMEPDFVRVYPTLVLKGSPLAKMWASKDYQAQSLSAAIALAKDIVNIFSKAKIPIVRMGLAPSESLDEDGVIIDGPYHPAFGHLVESAVFLEKALALLDEQKITHGPASFKVHPKSASKMRGHKNSNMDVLTNRLGAVPTIIQDPLLGLDDIRPG